VSSFLTRSHRQRGASLVIALVLLLVLCVLAVSGMGSASLQLTMAGNKQYTENAFQLAETAVDRSLQLGPFSTSLPNVVAETEVTGPDGLQIGTFSATTAFQEDTAPPGGGYSMGTGSGTFRAYHFRIDAQAQAQRGARDNHLQEFYVIGPGGP
jgi:hypothetical protein